ncbi:MAG: AAA family ATPase [Candidatus Micrarchaeota archaeon]|nr:AAA family ATPase [Candidatus Micrarchaeota archaeon]
MPVLAQKSLAGQKVKAYLKLAQESEGAWASIVVFLGALFLLGAIPFYPVYLVPVLAAICGIVAYKHPAFGMLLSFLLAFPAISYQSAIFGWVFALVISLVLFEMFEQWLVIAYLEILIMAPFSFGQLPFFGWFSILGMAIGAMRFGSKKSVIISIPAVFAILLLSSLWGVQNSAFLPVNLDIYKPLNSDLTLSKSSVDIFNLPSMLFSSLGSLADFSVLSKLNDAISKVGGNMLAILFSDSGLIQLASWSILLFAMAYISGYFKGKHAQFKSSLLLFLIVPVYFFISQMMKTQFRFEIIFAIGVTSIVIAVLEQNGIKISHETDVKRAENTKSFGKFGLQDMGVGGDEKGLGDVGGYEDVKTELKDSILLPLENKELSYAYGIKPPAGILLFGPPGTGKTMLMRALAKELKYGFYYIKSSDILSQWYGESLTGDQKIVILDKGIVKEERIDDVVNNKINAKVLCFNENNQVVFSDISGHIKHKSTSSIFEVQTRTGRKIKVTDYHSLFTYDGKSITSIPTHNLVAGKSHIVVPSAIHLDNQMNEKTFFEMYHNNGKDSRLKKIGSGIYLDLVEEIKQVKDEEFVYDISVDPTQNFVGGVGGIFAHNSEKNISEIFHIARSKAPSILFFDEIDSIGKKRTSYSADDVGPRVLSVLLQEMDGLKSGKTIIVVGATNVPHQLDAALLRPGRIDKIIYMHLPDKEARKAIFEVSCKKVPISEDVDFDKLALKTDRFSGADIKNIVQEAIKIAARAAGVKGVVVPVTMDYFLTVLKSIKPSTGIAQLEDYERFQQDFERRVGAKEEVKVKEDLVTWKDVAGLDDVRDALLETIEMPLLHEKEMKEFKIKPTKGILLFGPPGTGKTLIVKAATNELKATFQTMSGAELLKQGYAQAVNTIKEVFNRARENTPAIIFVDEIETLTAAAARSVSGEILGQFLVEMDGIKELKGVIVMGATNKPGLLDTAILRPGRFDKIFYVPPPNEKGRSDMFKIHLGNLAEGVDAAVLAKKTEGFTGADIAGICQDVKMSALKNRIASKSSKITTEDLLKVISRRRPSVTKDMLVEFENFMEEYGERR